MWLGRLLAVATWRALRKLLKKIRVRMRTVEARESIDSRGNLLPDW